MSREYNCSPDAVAAIVGPPSRLREIERGFVPETPAAVS